ARRGRQPDVPRQATAEGCVGALRAEPPSQLSALTRDSGRGARVSSCPGATRSAELSGRARSARPARPRALQGFADPGNTAARDGNPFGTLACTTARDSPVEAFHRVSQAPLQSHFGTLARVQA